MRLETDKSLLPFNTFGIDVAAKAFVELHSLEDLRAVAAEPRLAREPRLVLGGGSNILFRRDFDGLVLKNSLPGIEIVRTDAEHVWVRAAAGEEWHTLVMFSVERELAGLENLALIPGQVGAAPMQNIGAYGVEMSETCDGVEAVEFATGEPVVFANADCAFGYRDSAFKHQYRDRFLITAVTFRLARVPHFRIGYGDIQRTLHDMQVGTLTVRAVSDAVMRIRSAKLPDPKVLGNAGSFFKNPVVPATQFEALRSRYPRLPHYPQRDGGEKLPAGWLIEQCGWKGKVRGHVGVHAQQALVLVNHGGATGDEVYRLALDIQRSVHETFGVELIPEVNLL